MQAQTVQFESGPVQEGLFRLLLQDGEFRRYGLMVPPEAFSLEYLELAWEEVRGFFKMYKELPTHDVVISRVAGQSKNPQRRKLLEESLTRVLGQPMRNRGYLEERVVAFLRRQELAKLSQDIVDMVETEDAPANLLELRGKLDKIASIGAPSVDSGGLLKTAKDRLLTYLEAEPERIPTCFRHYGLGRGELGVVLAPPKRGKSLTLVNLGYAAVVNGYRVFHATLELREYDAKRRYDRAISGLTKQALRQAENHERAQSLITRLAKLRGEVFVKYFPANRWGCEDLYALLSYYSTQGQAFDLVVIDYADLMRPSRTYKDRRFELSNIYTDLRAIGGDFGVGVWTASQSTRATLNSEMVTMSDVAEDIGKMAVADMVLAFCQTKEERMMNPEAARVFVAGGREEVDGDIIPLEVDRDTSRLRVRA